jgi:hypothetical protein
MTEVAMLTAADLRMYEAAKRREPVTVTLDGKTRLGVLVCWNAKSNLRARIEWPSGNRATVYKDAVTLLFAGPPAPSAAA